MLTCAFHNARVESWNCRENYFHETSKSNFEIWIYLNTVSKGFVLNVSEWKRWQIFHEIPSRLVHSYVTNWPIKSILKLPSSQSNIYFVHLAQRSAGVCLIPICIIWHPFNIPEHFMFKKVDLQTYTRLFLTKETKSQSFHRIFHKILNISTILGHLLKCIHINVIICDNPRSLL